MTQKSQEAEDLRVRRTRKLLQQALMELTVEKGFAAVTVKDISERAMVNRSTVYRHYPGGKYDLIDQCINELAELVSAEQNWSVQKSGQPSDGVPTGLVKLLKHVQTFGDFFRVMLGQNGDPIFTQRFRQLPERRYRYLLSNTGVDTDPAAPPVDLKLNYISCAAVGAILWWLESGQPCSVEQFAIWLSKLSTASAGLSFPPRGTTTTAAQDSLP